MDAVAKDDVRRHVYDALQHCWQTGAVETLQAIWKRRCIYWDPREDTSPGRATAILHGQLRNAYMVIREITRETTRHPHRQSAAGFACTLLLQPSSETSQLPPPTRRLQHHLLFFDGGSRGNPGPGGAGSVVVQIGGSNWTPRVVWMASVSYASRTTNNAAGYQDLLVGLRYALRHPLRGLHVVGDSNLILTQQRLRRAPKAVHLQGSYTQYRMLADQLAVPTWTHHVRQFNKMADSLANIAMDTRRSTQVFASDIQALEARWPTPLKFLGAVAHVVDIHPDLEDDGRTSTIHGVT